MEQFQKYCGWMQRFQAEGNDELMERRSGAKVIAHTTAVISFMKNTCLFECVG
jgi:hypothetical protein